MKWSPEQNRALKAVARWSKSDQQVFRLFGYAGTGKTTLARHFAESMGGRTAFAAYTGKAAQVLSSKGCPATTIHKLIYVPKHKSKSRLIELQETLHEMIVEWNAEKAPDEEEPKYIQSIRADIIEEEENLKRAMFQLNQDSELKETDVLIVDECSMVDEQVGQDILYFGCKVLVLGDPAQLPPVRGGGFFTNAEPDFMLTEIHRQAKNSPIIELATRVRNREYLDHGTYGNCTVHRPGVDMTEIVLQADQILCGRNKTRRAANSRMRHLLGFDAPLPLATDRMVCLRNNHDEGLLNGQIWICAEDVISNNGPTYRMLAYNEDRENHQLDLTVWREEPEWYERKEAEEFDFGYALTCHKAQGSQWDHVVVFDESGVFKRDRFRWLYTAITRAAERLDIIDM